MTRLLYALAFLVFTPPLSAGIAAVWTGEIAVGGER